MIKRLTYLSSGSRADSSRSDVFMSNPLLSLLNIELPIIPSPMVGVSTPRFAAAVSNAGGLGSIGIGASSVEQARAMLRETAATASARPAP